MRTVFIILLALGSVSAFANEFCEAKLGFKEFSIESKKDGGLASANGNQFQLVYWENDELKVVPDAKITILKSVIFNEEHVDGNNGAGRFWTNKVTDYAVRVNVKTTTTEIYPAALGNRAVLDLTVSTMCTSIVRL